MCGDDDPCKPTKRPENVPKIDLTNVIGYNKKRMEEIGKDLTPIPNTRDTNDLDTDLHDSILDNSPCIESKISPLKTLNKCSPYCSKKRIIPIKLQTHKQIKTSNRNKNSEGIASSINNKVNKKNKESILTRMETKSPNPEIKCKVYKPVKTSYKSENKRESSLQSHNKNDNYFSVIQKKYSNKFKSDLTDSKTFRVRSVEKNNSCQSFSCKKINSNKSKLIKFSPGQKEFVISSTRNNPSYKHKDKFEAKNRGFYKYLNLNIVNYSTNIKSTRESTLTKNPRNLKSAKICNPTIKKGLKAKTISEKNAGGIHTLENTCYSNYEKSVKKVKNIKKINVDLDSFHITINMDGKEPYTSRDDTLKSDDSKTEFDAFESKNDSLSFAVIADEPAVKPISNCSKEKCKILKMSKLK